MKNVFKIPNLNPRKGLKPLRGLAVALLLPLVCGWGATSCSLFSEPEPELPPATQIGANTLGFKVNGKNWVPKDEGMYPPGSSIVRANGGGGRLSILNTMIVGGFQANSDNKMTSTFYIELYNFTAYKTYSAITMILDNKWSTSKNQPWKLEISKYDTTQRIIAGTFSFVGTAKDGSTINITDGRFDIKYYKEQ